jgi:hypothetical protein
MKTKAFEVKEWKHSNIITIHVFGFLAAEISIFEVFNQVFYKIKYFGKIDNHAYKDIIFDSEAKAINACKNLIKYYFSTLYNIEIE